MRQYATRRNRFALSFVNALQLKKTEEINRGDTEGTEEKERRAKAMGNAKLPMQHGLQQKCGLLHESASEAIT
jgi:hypothetical protein